MAPSRRSRRAPRNEPMRSLYFDIDGTLVCEGTGEVKPALAEGRFERAVRNASFDRIVCVGNAVSVVRAVAEFEASVDPHGVVFFFCGGAFENKEWFEQAVDFVSDPHNRAAEIDVGEDWWYADDLAEYYCRRAGREQLFEAQRGRRILAPEPQGDGREVLEWIQRIAASEERDRGTNDDAED